MVCYKLVFAVNFCCAQESAPASTQRSGEVRPQAATTPELRDESAEGYIASQAGPQKADEEGRTRLPMTVRKSVSFREIGPAISGGRVPAVG